MVSVGHHSLHFPYTWMIMWGQRLCSSFVLLLCVCVYYLSSSSLASVVSGVPTDEALGDATDETCETSSWNEGGACKLTSSKEAECQDSQPQCVEWTQRGECHNNPNYMQLYCQKSCGTCGQDSFVESVVANEETLETDPTSVEFGVAQVIQADAELGVSRHAIQGILKRSQAYHLSLSKHIQEICRNEHALCSLWAAMGECPQNPNYMKTVCAPACTSCDYLTIDGRCPIDPNAPNAWQPGDVNRLFQRLTAEPLLSEHSVEILSSPPEGPWIITMENMITPEEARRLIELGDIEGYRQSTGVGKRNAQGRLESLTNEHRTSYNAWCQNDCYRDPVALEVIYRLSNLTRINETNSEYLQLLRYEPGQYYLPHHDYIPEELERQQGVRILTVFLYLNDVEQGGETEFTTLGNLQVQPKLGRALIWPSVLDEEPNQMDSRTIHQALRVQTGIKYGANAWFHMRDFKTPNRNDCQG